MEKLFISIFMLLSFSFFACQPSNKQKGGSDASVAQTESSKGDYMKLFLPDILLSECLSKRRFA